MFVDPFDLPMVAGNWDWTYESVQSVPARDLTAILLREGAMSADAQDSLITFEIGQWHFSPSVACEGCLFLFSEEQFYGNHRCADLLRRKEFQ